MAVSYTTSSTPLAVTFDVAGETESFSFDAGSASDRVLFVAVMWRTRANDITGITYNGVSLTSVLSIVSEGIISLRVFALYGPASGTNTVAVTMSSGSNSSLGLISCLVVDGADSGTPWDTAVSAHNTVSTANAQSSVTVTSATDDRVVFFHAVQNSVANLTATPTDYTERFDGNNGSGYSFEGGDAAGASSITGIATWNNGANSTSWIGFGINVNAAAASGFQAAWARGANILHGASA